MNEVTMKKIAEHQYYKELSHREKDADVIRRNDKAVKMLLDKAYKLPDDYRIPFLLFVEGLTDEEIANEIGMTEDLVRVRVFDAQKIIRKYAVLSGLFAEEIRMAKSDLNLEYDIFSRNRMIRRSIRFLEREYRIGEKKTRTAA